MMIYQWRRTTPVDEEVYRERIRKIEDDWIDPCRYGIMAEPTWALPAKPAEVRFDKDSGMPLDFGDGQDYPFDDGELS
jgi:hypothetical protein